MGLQSLLYMHYILMGQIDTVGGTLLRWVKCKICIVITDLINYYENGSFFFDIIGRNEAFSDNRFQVSGVRFQAGYHFLLLTPDT